MKLCARLPDIWKNIDYVMKYIVRALKYFLYLAVILTVVISLLVAFKVVDANLETMFVHGYDSIWQIALIMLAISAIYPRTGYTTRSVDAPGEYKDLRKGVMEVMENRGYVLEKEDGENLSFRKRSLSARILKIWEDRITLTRTFGGWNAEGLTRDLVRVISALESKLNPQEL